MLMNSLGLVFSLRSDARAINSAYGITTRFVTIHDMRSLDQTKEKRTALQIFDSSGGANGVLNLCDLLHLSGQDVRQEIYYRYTSQPVLSIQ